MKPSINIPAFVICLEREPNRKARINQHLASFNIPFKFSNAVDGQLLSKKEKEQFYSESKAIQIRGRALAAGELGCYLSHYNIWKKMVLDNISQALIIETDAIFCQEAINSINKISHLEKDWDLIMLYYRECYPSFWQKQQLTKKTALVKFSNKCAGTVSYMITLSGAKKLLKNALPICLPVDDYMTGGYINKGINLYAAYPRTIHHDENVDSLIRPDINDIVGYDTLARRKNKKKNTIKQLEKRARYFIKRLKPGPWL